MGCRTDNESKIEVTDNIYYNPAPIMIDFILQRYMQKRGQPLHKYRINLHYSHIFKRGAFLLFQLFKECRR